MTLDVNEIIDIITPGKKKLEIPANPVKPSIKKNTGSSRSKKKGNKYENEIAKALGKWIFNDPDMLSRSITSGAKKTVYTGDIVPQKQMPKWNKWFVHVECKSGYENQIPTFNNFAIIEKWLTKCLEEVDFDRQPVIWLVCRFHGYSSILLTNCMFQTANWGLCVNIQHNGLNNFFYTYKLKELMEYDFYELVDHNLFL